MKLKKNDSLLTKQEKVEQKGDGEKTELRNTEMFENFSNQTDRIQTVYITLFVKIGYALFGLA